MTIKIYQLKKGKKNKLARWGRELMTIHKKEAIKSLREENVTQEGAFLFSKGKTDYVIFYVEGKNMLPANMKRSINKKHRSILKDCISHSIQVTEVYNLE